MRIAALILSLFVVLTFGSCTEKTMECSDFPDTLTVTIRNGETKTIYECEDAEVKLTFDKVNDDSRCPTGATCVWQGTAHITLNFNNSPDNIVLELSKEHSVEYLGNTYSMLFEALNPYPSIDQQIKNYTATLRFTKK